jgi:hypothetical protein
MIKVGWASGCAAHAGLREGTHAEDCRKQKHPAPKQSDLRSEKG